MRKRGRGKERERRGGGGGQKRSLTGLCIKGYLGNKQHVYYIHAHSFMFMCVCVWYMGHNHALNAYMYIHVLCV